MRKITCEHCGTNIDTSQHFRCPICNAPYTKSSEYKEYVNKAKYNAELDTRNKELEIQIKEMVNGQMKSVFNTTSNIAKKIFTGFVIILIISMVIIFFSIMSMSKYSEIKELPVSPDNQEPTIPDYVEDYIKDNIENNIPNNPSDYENPVIVDMGLEAVNDKFIFSVTDVYYAENINTFYPNDGYKYVYFKLKITNKTNKGFTTFDNEYRCTVDGVTQEEATFFDHKIKRIDKILNPQTTTEGYVIYEVPKDANTFQVTFNNNLTINVTK